METWYIGEISKLTGISKRTLHHYDSIQLFSPSIRTSNGYRIYSDTDLIRLQKILIFKGMRFKLKAIQEILKKNSQDIVIILREQLQILGTETVAISKTINSIKKLIDEYEYNDQNSTH